MAKQIKTIIKLQCPAGKANPAPPVGPALGQHGVNIMEFCQSFNEQTKEKGNTTIPVEITVYVDRTFSFILKSPPAAVLIKEALKITSRYSSITDVASNHGQDTVEPVMLSDNRENHDQKVSIFASRKIEEMVKDTNFDFEIVKLSFADGHHDIQADLTITSSLGYIDFYDKTLDENYLELFKSS